MPSVSGSPPHDISARRVVRVLVALAIPPAAALAAIHADPLGAYAARRPGLLALGMFAVAGAMLWPAVRRWLLVVLAYGAALLALEGAWLRPSGGRLNIPTEGPLSLLHYAYPWAWVTLFVLAATAGTLEAIRPGTVLAKRCLFGAAAVYLLGHGMAGMLDRPNVISLVSIATGIGSLLGALTVHRFGIHHDSDAPLDDVPSAAALAADRRKRLAQMEWRDPDAVH